MSMRGLRFPRWSAAVDNRSREEEIRYYPPLLYEPTETYSFLQIFTLSTESRVSGERSGHRDYGLVVLL